MLGYQTHGIVQAMWQAREAKRRAAAATVMAQRQWRDSIVVRARLAAWNRDAAPRA